MSKYVKKKTTTKTIELDINEAIKIKERLENISVGDKIIISKKDEKLFQMAAQLIDTLVSIYGMWNNSKKKINKLLKMVFGNCSEKIKDLKNITSTNNIDDHDGQGNSTDSGQNNDNDNSKGSSDKDCDNANDKENNNNVDDEEKKKKKREGGGGKNSADDYESAAEITCNLEDEKQPGEICPECKKSKLYEIEPKKVIRLVGNAPITAFEFILQQVRCICGAIFTADVGNEFREIYNENKYSPSALAAMMIYKYLMGVSFGTLASIQQMNGVPLPASTQANKIKTDALPTIQAIVDVLKNLASNAAALGFDDTVIRTLEKRLTKKGGTSHRGHGTAIVANGFDCAENEIILFDFDSSKHAGDVVCDILSSRTRDSLPLLISDGLNSYDKCKKSGVDINCNTHARRKVVEEDPERKSYLGQAVLDCYSEIYKNDKYCKENNLISIDRMVYHQKHSSFYFEKIKVIFEIIAGVQIEVGTRKSYNIPDYLAEDEPNSDVRTIANYFLKRYKTLTRVVDVPGVPLDTNYVERMIKIIIRIRKNSLFFNNVSSAYYSGEILSLLETAVQNQVNVFDYMKYLLSHKKEVLATPRNYLPWLYKLTAKEKNNYWKKVDAFTIIPSNPLEFSTGKSYRSSA